MRRARCRMAPSSPAWMGCVTCWRRRSDVFYRTLTEKMLIYALGRDVDTSDAPAVRSIMREAASRQYRAQALVVAIVKSLPFQDETRREHCAANARRDRSVATSRKEPVRTMMITQDVRCLGERSCAGRRRARPAFARRHGAGACRRGRHSRAAGAAGGLHLFSERRQHGNVEADRDGRGLSALANARRRSSRCATTSPC